MMWKSHGRKPKWPLLGTKIQKWSKNDSPSERGRDFVEIQRHFGCRSHGCFAVDVQASWHAIFHGHGDITKDCRCRSTSHTCLFLSIHSIGLKASMQTSSVRLESKEARLELIALVSWYWEKQNIKTAKHSFRKSPQESFKKVKIEWRNLCGISRGAVYKGASLDATLCTALLCANLHKVWTSQPRRRMQNALEEPPIFRHPGVPVTLQWRVGLSLAKSANIRVNLFMPLCGASFYVALFVLCEIKIQTQVSGEFAYE